MQHTQPNNRTVRTPPPGPPPQAHVSHPPHQRQRRAKKKSSTMVYWLVGGGALAAGVVLVTLMLFLGLFVVMNQRVAEGVTVAGSAVGGQNETQAAQTVARISTYQSVTMIDGDRSWPVALVDLGIGVDEAFTLDRVLEAEPNSAVTPRYTVDLSTASEGLRTLAENYADIEPIPGRPGTPGREVDIPAMLERLRADLNGEIADGNITLTMIETEAPWLNANNYTGEPITYTVQQGQELGLIAKEYGVEVADILQLNDISDPNFIFPGQELLIPAPDVFEPAPENAPTPPTQQGRSIVVDTSTQRIYAYENGQLVRSHLTSTGTNATPTVLGDYNIYVKHVETNMSGADYFLPDVPYTMYFYQGYGIHGTYWHNSFGRPMSHGCVNLPIDEARWFFDFAEVGTPVRVI